MNIMSMPYRMAETPQGTTPVTIPNFTSKTKVATTVAKKGAEAGAALLTAGAAALTGQVLANKSKRLSVGEITNDSIEVLSKKLPEMSKEELKVLDANCDKALGKCNKYLKSRPSYTVEMYRDLLEEESSEIKKQLASNVYHDIRAFYNNNIGDIDEPEDISSHIDYSNADKETMNNLNKKIDGFIEECDKYTCGNVEDELEEYKNILKEEKRAIEYIPKLEDMSFEEIYAQYTGSASVLDQAIFEHLMAKHFTNFYEKEHEIEKMCSNYEKGCANYLHATGNTKKLIENIMIDRYGYHCLENIN